MSCNWLRTLRHLLVVGIVFGAATAAFGAEQPARPQSPVETYLATGRYDGAVMPASAEQSVQCGTGCNAVADSCCGGCDSWCGTALDYFAPGSDNCGCNTWTFGAEALMLKGFNSGGAFGDLTYKFGYRFWAAWQRPDGLGVRLRYFDYNQTVAGSSIDTDSLDLEVMDSLQLGCNWTLIVAGGIRYTDFVATGGADFHGVGPVVSAELYRTINCNTQLYGITRTAILIDDGDNGAAADDSTISITEIQLGIQRTWDLNNGALAFGRLGYEAQWYADSMTAGTTSATLHGFNFSLGVIY
jgi:hypothetical protein